MTMKEETHVYHMLMKVETKQEKDEHQLKS